MRYKVIIGLPRWHFTGPFVFAERLVRGLLAEGHDARILLTEKDCNLVQEPWPEHPMPPDLPCDKLPAGPDDTWGQRWEALERYLEERAPCFYIMLHDWRNNVIAPRLSRRVRLIGLVQADSELEIGQATRLGEYWDAIVAVSDPIHFKLVDKLSYLAPRMVTIRNAVPSLEVPPPKPADGPLRIAYSGELRPHQKRLHDMVEIARRLADRGVPFHLTFFGEGSHRAVLEDKSRDLMARGQVSFPGRLDADALLEALASQHIFLLTSEFEGLSIALLEAMSRGCVPVASQLSSQSMVIRPGANALTAKVGDIEAFSRHLETLARDRSGLARLSRAAFDTIAEEGYRVRDMLDSYLRLFGQVESLSSRGGFVRRRGNMLRPTAKVGKVDILQGDCEEECLSLDKGAAWPDPPDQQLTVRAQSHELPPVSLEDHKILITALPDRISGVDIFAVHLVRGLCARGFDARILGNRPSDQSESLSCLQELKFEERNPSLGADYLGWPDRWRVMLNHLSSLGPCIYLPNYDHDFSCIAPQLPAHVRTVGIGHSDDPWHYEPLCRIGHGCDALVGVSRAITEHLRGLMPGFTGKLSTIPYGIPTPGGELPGAAARRSRDAKQPLRIVYTGRLVGLQKRALDLVAIARALDKRGVPLELVVMGDGELRPAMERAARDLILERKIWFTGAQPNACVLEFMQTCDVFLMPSAFEGLSVGLLEAMSRGLVPVVSDIRSGVPDVIVHRENGLVVPVGDIPAFADRLEWLWKNPADLRRLGAAAAATVGNNFTVDQMVDRYVELFRQMVATPSKRIPGPIVPPKHLADEIKWTTWVGRIAADPMASARRVARRFLGVPRL